MRQFNNFALAVVMAAAAGGFAPGSDRNDGRRKEVLDLLMAVEFSGSAYDRILQRGDYAISVVRDVLQSPAQYETGQVERSLVVISESEAPDRRDLIVHLLSNDSPRLRACAARHFATVAKASDTAIFIALVHDPDKYVRYAGIDLLGRLADTEAALDAIRIWRVQVMAADRNRTLQEKWLTNYESNTLEKSITAIRKRIEEKKPGDESRVRQGDRVP